MAKRVLLALMALCLALTAFGASSYLKGGYWIADYPYEVGSYDIMKTMVFDGIDSLGNENGGIIPYIFTLPRGITIKRLEVYLPDPDADTIRALDTCYVRLRSGTTISTVMVTGFFTDSTSNFNTTTETSFAAGSVCSLVVDTTAADGVGVVANGLHPRVVAWYTDY